jgi:hypothetical protein
MLSNVVDIDFSRHLDEINADRLQQKRKFMELEQRLEQAEKELEDLKVVLPDRYKENTANSVIKVCDQDWKSKGVGFYISDHVVVTVLHNLFDTENTKESTIETMIASGKAVFNGKNISNEPLRLNLCRFNVKYDFAVLKCDTPSKGQLVIQSCEKLHENTKELAVTSFQIGHTSAVNDSEIVDEDFTVIPAILLKRSSHHIVYVSNLLGGDSGGSIIFSKSGSAIAIHVEYFNEADKVPTEFAKDEVLSSLGSLTMNAGGGYLGLRLDCEEVQAMINSAMQLP